MTEHRSQTTLPNNLPVQLTSFVGRERETAEVKRLLTPLSLPYETGTRVLTLTGAGGCGKTRLALAVADVLCRGRSETCPYADGVWFVEFASLADPALVAQRVAAALDVREQPGEALVTTLAQQLRNKQLLLLLDNCEHLSEACAQFADTLLRECADVMLLTTSREPLRVTGERLYLVPSLGYPTLNVPSPTSADFDRARWASDLGQYEAVQLFTERAHAVQPTFTLTPQNALAVAQICRRLDGIPLALELAAARVRMLTPQQIAARLDDSLRLLTRPDQQVLSRHQTLRAALDWSYDLLSDKQRALFRRLSVFAGGFTLEAAEAVCVDDTLRAEDVLDVLSDLVDQSLVVILDTTQAEMARYRLLETIRQYAGERLGEAGESKRMQDRHLDFCRQLAETASPRLRSAEQVTWLARLTREYDNMQAALAWSLDRRAIHTRLPRRAEIGIQLADALQHFWRMRGDPSEGRRWLEKALMHSPSLVRPRLHASLLYGVSHFKMVQGDFNGARACLEESAAIYQRLDDKNGWGYAIGWLAQVMMERGEVRAALPLAQQSVELLRTGIDRWGLARSLFVLGRANLALADFTAARAAQRESISLFRELGDKWHMAYPLGHLGMTALGQRDYAAARAISEERLAIGREFGAQSLIAYTITLVGYVALCQGDYARARYALLEAVTRFSKLGIKRDMAIALERLARLATAQKQPVRAARLFGAVQVMHETIGFRNFPQEQAEVESAMACIRSQLDEATFDRAWAAGRALTLEQAIDEAMQVTVTDSSASTTLHDPDALTPREREVLSLVAQGMSDAQVADQLVLSRRTINAHLTSIYRKLGVNSRSAATRYALDHKLV